MERRSALHLQSCLLAEAGALAIGHRALRRSIAALVRSRATLSSAFARRSASSWQGVRSDPRVEPRAARVRNASRPRGPRHTRIAVASPVPGSISGASPPRSSGLLRHQDASRVAPLSEQGARKMGADSARGITFFRGSYPRTPLVMAGLSRPSTTCLWRGREDMDARHKAFTPIFAGYGRA